MPLSGSQLKEFEELYARSLQQAAGQDAKLLQVCTRMIEILTAAKEADICRVKPHTAGVHGKNRGGKRMQASKMMRKGAGIVRAGFSWELATPSKIVAFEDHPTIKHIEAATMELTKTSPMFGRYDDGTIKVGTVGGGHLNQFLHAVNCGVPTDQPALCKAGEDVISKRLLVEGDSRLADALDNGLKMTVINWRIEEAYPGLPSVLQAALNIEHSIGEGHLILHWAPSRLLETYPKIHSFLFNRFAHSAGPGPGRLGGDLGASWGVLEASWGRLGVSWGRLGASQSHLGMI